MLGKSVRWVRKQHAKRTTKGLVYERGALLSPQHVYELAVRGRTASQVSAARSAAGIFDPAVHGSGGSHRGFDLPKTKTDRFKTASHRQKTYKQTDDRQADNSERNPVPTVDASWPKRSDVCVCARVRVCVTKGRKERKRQAESRGLKRGMMRKKRRAVFASKRNPGQSGRRPLFDWLVVCRCPTACPLAVLCRAKQRACAEEGGW